MSAIGRICGDKVNYCTDIEIHKLKQYLISYKNSSDFLTSLLFGAVTSSCKRLFRTRPQQLRECEQTS